MSILFKNLRAKGNKGFDVHLSPSAKGNMFIDSDIGTMKNEGQDNLFYRTRIGRFAKEHPLQMMSVSLVVTIVGGLVIAYLAFKFGWV